MMTPIELIDQMLGRTPFNCTEKQMRFLRDLVIQQQNPETLKKAMDTRKKVVLAALRREVTNTKKAFEAAQKELKDAESEGVE